MANEWWKGRDDVEDWGSECGVYEWVEEMAQADGG